MARTTEPEYAMPAWAERLTQQENQGLLFVDPDFVPMHPAVQAAFMLVINDPSIGDLDLPEGVEIITANNIEPTDFVGLPPEPNRSTVSEQPYLDTLDAPVPTADEQRQILDALYRD